MERGNNRFTRGCKRYLDLRLGAAYVRVMSERNKTETQAERAAREKAERLAEALRANLKRRKAQARQRDGADTSGNKGQSNG
ncbi:hypothetical protein DFR53_3213 [Pontivivens insulae]|nr:hypothetical protein DFR53_3213 [Pontivivens insulae]